MKLFGDFIEKKIFLGGTCNDSTWRDEIIKSLTKRYFNPVVDDWTEEAYQEELKQRETCDYCLYVITPKMKGTYSIAEVVDDSNKRPAKTIFAFLTNDGSDSFDTSQIKSLEKVGEMVKKNGAQYIKHATIDNITKYLNEL